MHGLCRAPRRGDSGRRAASNTGCGEGFRRAVEYLPVAKVVNLARCIEQCKEAGFWVYGADMDELLYTEGDYKGLFM